MALRPVMFRGDATWSLGGGELEKVKVEAVVAEHLRGEKLRVFKYKAKKGYRKRAGHRSELTRLEVTEVKMLTRKPAAKRRPRPSGEPDGRSRRRRSPARRSRPRRSPPRRSAAAKKPAAKKPAAKKPAARRIAPRRRRRASEMAHKKGLGSSRNGRDSNPKMLGVKVFAGQRVGGGEIIVRQRGTRFRAGDGAGIGRDHTIFATRAGTVEFKPARKGRIVSVAERRVARVAAGGVQRASSERRSTNRARARRDGG